MTDLELIIAAGIDPKTGLPIRAKGAHGPARKDNVKTQLRILDEQNAVNRYRWYNLPDGLTGQMIERILYYRGQGIFFMLAGKLQFLPFAMTSPENGTGIDMYGRFTKVRPMPFMGSAETKQSGANFQWLTDIELTPIYEVYTPSDLLEMLEDGKSIEDIQRLTEDFAVILHDFTPQQSFTNIPRQQIQEPILDIMSDCIPFMRTALLNSTGVQGVRITTADDAANVLAANRSLDVAALTGDKYVPIINTLEMQELTGGNPTRAEEFMLALQSLDNYRLSLYGLENGGLFQKRSHMLEAEQRTNQSNSGLVMEDGLANRQRVCDILNSIMGFGIWVEPDSDNAQIDLQNDLMYDKRGEIEDATSTSIQFGDNTNIS